MITSNICTFCLFRPNKKRSFNLLCVLDLFFRTLAVNCFRFFFQAWLSRIGSANRQRSEISKGGAHERDYSFGWRISGAHCRTAKVSSVEQLIPLSPYTMICLLDFAAGQMFVSFSQGGSAVLFSKPAKSAEKVHFQPLSIGSDLPEVIAQSNLRGE